MKLRNLLRAYQNDKNLFVNLKMFAYICANIFFMKLTGILIVNSVLITIGLLSSGAYLIIDNLVEPTGNLFEGIVIFSLGTIMSLLLIIASTLGKVIQTFTNVYTQQVEIQQKVN